MKRYVQIKQNIVSFWYYTETFFPVKSNNFGKFYQKKHTNFSLVKTKI